MNDNRRVNQGFSRIIASTIESYWEDKKLLSLRSFDSFLNHLIISSLKIVIVQVCVKGS